MRASVGIVGLVLVAACARTGTVQCGDSVCPGGTVCAQLTAPDETLCAKPQQQDACSGKAENDSCSFDMIDGWCHDGTCIEPECGNKRLDPGEKCDDGNTVTGDGTCSADCKSTEVCGNGRVDPLKLEGDLVIPNEQCDDGNTVSNDGCSSRCQLETAQWTQLGFPLPALSSPAMAYDSARGRVVLFGGESRPSAASSNPFVANPYTFEWDGTSWGMVPTLVAPTARFNAGMVYDSARQVIVLFAGRAGDDDGPLGDLWEYDGAAWKLRQFTNGPGARSKFGMVYDSVRKKVVVFGGFGPASNGMPHTLADTWEWDGTSWTETTGTGGPAARMEPIMGFDAKRGVTIMAGGWEDLAGSSTDTVFRDTWRYDGTWTNLGASPPAFDEQSAIAFDAVSGQLITYGGRVHGGSQVAETWAFDGTSWNNLNKSAPGAMGNLALASDPRRGRVVLYGGELGLQGSYAATWVFNGTDWTQATTASSLPARRHDAAIASDTTHGIAWMFGGTDEQNTALGDMWSFDGIRWAPHPTSSGPSARSLPTMAYDPLRDRIVLFGGGDPATNGLMPAETWLWNGTGWVQGAGTQPPARIGATMFWDVSLQQVVLHGGFANGNSLADTWAWNGAAWTPLTATGGPARAAACSAYDPVHAIDTLYGGLEITTVPTALVIHDETFSWASGAWTMSTTATRPPSRYMCGMAYDPTARQSVLLGGTNVGQTRFSDTWAWSAAPATVGWSPVLPLTNPSRRNGMAMASDPSGAGVFLFGGQIGDVSSPDLQDTWRFRYVSPDTPELCSVSTVDRDHDGKVGCDDDDCWATCKPDCPPGTTCPMSARKCGDGTCGPVETCRSCPGDCGACTPVCGDGFCDPGETAATCKGDCP